eukprot:gene33126-40877_t
MAIAKPKSDITAGPAYVNTKLTSAIVAVDAGQDEEEGAQNADQDLADVTGTQDTTLAEAVGNPGTRLSHAVLSTDVVVEMHGDVSTTTEPVASEVSVEVHTGQHRDDPETGDLYLMQQQDGGGGEDDSWVDEQLVEQNGGGGENDPVESAAEVVDDHARPGVEQRAALSASQTEWRVDEVSVAVECDLLSTPPVTEAVESAVEVVDTGGAEQCAAAEAVVEAVVVVAAVPSSVATGASKSAMASAMQMEGPSAVMAVPTSSTAERSMSVSPRPLTASVPSSATSAASLTMHSRLGGGVTKVGLVGGRKPGLVNPPRTTFFMDVAAPLSCPVGQTATARRVIPKIDWIAPVLETGKRKSTAAPLSFLEALSLPAVARPRETEEKIAKYRAVTSAPPPPPPLVKSSAPLQLKTSADTWSDNRNKRRLPANNREYVNRGYVLVQSRLYVKEGSVVFAQILPLDFSKLPGDTSFDCLNVQSRPNGQLVIAPSSSPVATAAKSSFTVSYSLERGLQVQARWTNKVTISGAMRPPGGAVFGYHDGMQGIWPGDEIHLEIVEQEYFRTEVFEVRSDIPAYLEGIEQFHAVVRSVMPSATNQLKGCSWFQEGDILDANQVATLCKARVVNSSARSASTDSFPQRIVSVEGLTHQVETVLCGDLMSHCVSVPMYSARTKKIEEVCGSFKPIHVKGDRSAEQMIVVTSLKVQVFLVRDILSLVEAKSGAKVSHTRLGTNTVLIITTRGTSPAVNRASALIQDSVWFGDLRLRWLCDARVDEKVEALKGRVALLRDRGAEEEEEVEMVTDDEWSDNEFY